MDIFCNLVLTLLLSYATAYFFPESAQRYNDEVVETWFRKAGDGATRQLESIIALMPQASHLLLAVAADCLLAGGFGVWLFATRAFELFFIGVVCAAASCLLIKPRAAKQE